MSEKKKHSGSNGKLWFGFTKEQVIDLNILLQSLGQDALNSEPTLKELAELFKRRALKLEPQKVAPQISK